MESESLHHILKSTKMIWIIVLNLFTALFLSSIGEVFKSHLANFLALLNLISALYLTLLLMRF